MFQLLPDLNKFRFIIVENKTSNSSFEYYILNDKIFKINLMFTSFK